MDNSFDFDVLAAYKMNVRRKREAQAENGFKYIVLFATEFVRTNVAPRPSVEDRNFFPKHYFCHFSSFGYAACMNNRQRDDSTFYNYTNNGLYIYK